jgi:hypothetical protein
MKIKKVKSLYPMITGENFEEYVIQLNTSIKALQDSIWNLRQTIFKEEEKLKELESLYKVAKSLCTIEYEELPKAKEINNDVSGLGIINHGDARYRD